MESSPENNEKKGFGEEIGRHQRYPAKRRMQSPRAAMTSCMDNIHKTAGAAPRLQKLHDDSVYIVHAATNYSSTADKARTSFTSISCRFVVQQAVRQISNKSNVYIKSTASQHVEMSYRCSLSVFRNQLKHFLFSSYHSTPSAFEVIYRNALYKLLTYLLTYRLLYDLLYNESTIDRSSGAWACVKSLHCN